MGRWDQAASSGHAQTQPGGHDALHQRNSASMKRIARHASLSHINQHHGSVCLACDFGRSCLPPSMAEYRADNVYPVHQGRHL